jgi:hypothetical protein
MTLYDVAINMAREERGLVAFAKKNDVSFDGEACGSDRTLGMVFMTPGDTVRDHAALLDQAARQIVEHVRLSNDKIS